MLLDVAAAQMSERTLELLAHDWAGSGLGPKDRSMRKSGRRCNGKDAPILFSNGSRVGGSVLSEFDAFGCLRSLRARLALDWVSWV